MQKNRAARSNRERTEATRGALIRAARELFVSQGYAATSTPEIVAAAGVTRGALYHHFADKPALFRAVAEQESANVAAEIEQATPPHMSPRQALIRGGEAFLQAMTESGRTRLLLLDGPAVLGREVMDEIDRTHAARTLREGLAAAMDAGAVQELPLTALTAILSAAFDRAALAVSADGQLEEYQQVLAAVIAGLVKESA